MLFELSLAVKLIYPRTCKYQLRTPLRSIQATHAIRTLYCGFGAIHTNFSVLNNYDYNPRV